MQEDWADATVKVLMMLETPAAQAAYLRIIKDQIKAETYTEAQMIFKAAFDDAPSLGGGDK